MELGSRKKKIILWILLALLLILIFIPKTDEDLVLNGVWVCRTAPIVLGPSGDGSIEIDGEDVCIFFGLYAKGQLYQIMLASKEGDVTVHGQRLLAGSCYTAFGKLILTVETDRLWNSGFKVLIFDNIATE